MRMSSVIERRLLVNFRVDPAAAAKLLPPGLRPQLASGWAVGGICLIRLGQVRQAGLPRGLGVRSENAAHRIAVEWDGPDGRETGVYIPRRDSGSALTVAAGGRLFPGVHHRARFDVRETEDELRVGFESRDGSAYVSVRARPVPELVGSELFADRAVASEFFRTGAVGWSATRDGLSLDGIELGTDAWRIEAAEISEVRSSFFDDRDRFPPGSVAVDSALVMRDLPVRWKALAPRAVRVADHEVSSATRRRECA